jgi:hypothetical protein
MLEEHRRRRAVGVSAEPSHSRAELRLEKAIELLCEPTCAGLSAPRTDARPIDAQTSCVETFRVPTWRQ